MKNKILMLWMRTGAALGLALLASSTHAQTTVTTIGGGNPNVTPKYQGYRDGVTFNQALFNTPCGMAFDPSGTAIFLADYTNNAIRVISNAGNTATSVTTTFANVTNGIGINRPIAVMVDGATNVYVLNHGNGTNGSVLHLSGLYFSSGVGLVYPPLVTNLSNATAMAMDGLTNLYVTVSSNTVMRITPGGAISTVGTIATNGVNLQGIAILDDGRLALSDAGNQGIWLMSQYGLATRLTGFHGSADTNGPATIAAFNHPENISKAGGGVLVVADRGNHKVKLVSVADGTVSLLYGVSSNYWYNGTGIYSYPGWLDGTAGSVQGDAEARLPYGVLVAPDGSVYTTEQYYQLIRHVTATGLSAPKPGYPPLFNNPAGIAVDSSGANLYIADYTNNAVEILGFGNNQTTTYLTTAEGISRPASVLLDTNDNLYVLNQNSGGNGNIISVDPYGNLLGTNVTGLNNPTAFTMDANGNIFVAEQAGAVRAVFPSGAVNTIVTITNANVSLQGIAVFDDGMIAVSDAGNQVIWTVNALTKTVSRLTGQLGSSGTTLGSSNYAKLYQPHQLARAGNNQLVIADTGNNRLVTVTRTGSITNVLVSTNATLWFGRPTDPIAKTDSRFVQMVSPVGVAVSSSGNVYASETYYQDIRGLTAPLAAPDTLPNVLLPYFVTPDGVAFDPYGNNLFIADRANNAVDMLDLNNNYTSTFLTGLDGISQPASVWVDTNEFIYVLNQNGGSNGSILAFDIYGNPYGTVASGLTLPTAFLEDNYGNFFVAEQAGNIRVFGTGISNTIVTITNANVSLQGIALFDDGTIAVSDAGNHVIWTVNAITKAISRLTGQLGTNGITLGASNYAKLYQPHQLARAGGNQLVVADYGNNRLVTVSRFGSITNVLNSTNAAVWFGQAGDPVANTSSKFVPMVLPAGAAVGNGIVFASETYYEDIRGLTGSSVSYPSFNPGVPLPFYSGPAGIALNSTSTLLFIADPTNNLVSELNLANNQTSVFLNASNGIYRPVDVALDSSDNLYVLNQGTGGNGSILEFDKYGNLLGTNANSLTLPTAMRLSFAGDLYVAELNGAVQKFNASGSNTLATITTNANVQLQGIALLDNNSVVVSDAGNQVLWKISQPATNTTLFTGIIGSPGANLGAVGFARLNHPLRLAQASGGLLLIVDSGNNRVVVADDQGTISSVLNSTNANLWFGSPIDPVSTNNPNYVSMQAPAGVAIGAAGTVFVSEDVYKDIRGLLNTGIQAPIPPPATPINLVATPAYGQVSLTWSAIYGATNYNVKRSPSTGGPFNLVGSTSAISFTDTNVLNGSTYYFVVSAVNGGGESPNSAEVSALVPWPPVPNPQIGYVDFPATSTPVEYTSVFHPVSAYTFYNDANIVIVGTPGTSTYYTYDGSIPTTNSSSVLSDYQDGIASASDLTPYLVPQVAPTLKIMTMGAQTNRPNSAVVQASFQFVTGNPTIIGNNAAQFTISDITANAHLYYTIDGSIPSSTNGVDLGTVATPTNVWTVGFPILTNTLFQVVAVRNNYQPSAVVSTSFSPSNFVANVISFGFASGEASSEFLAAPGQNFYAPVTLSVLPNTTIYSLQFNLTVNSAGTNAGPAVGTGDYSFSSMLVKPDAAQTGVYIRIPPYMFETSGTNPPPTASSILYEGNWFQNLTFTNASQNLLGVGWLERASMTNLYITSGQDLIQYSLAHNDVFQQSGGDVILGGYTFQVPATATNGQTYQIQIGRPSATADGLGSPGSDVFIAAPTNGNNYAGAPISALKYVTVTNQIKYVAGSVYPFRWFNAGDFGSTNIVNADVINVFVAAVYNFNNPMWQAPGSDFADAFDSCGNLGVLDQDPNDANFNYYTNAGAYTNSYSIDNLFDGNDTTINQIAFGDGQLDVCDVYVTFRRSLDPSLTWYRRFWNNGQRVADTGAANVASHIVSKAQTKTVSTTSTVEPQVNFTAGDIQGSAGQLVQIPINATIFGSYPLRVLMLNLTVEPLDGSPALTTPVQFTQTAPLGTPYTTDSTGNGNYSAVWLNSTNAGVTGTVTLGTLTVTIPTGASANAAYAVHFDHASASPNGIASFPKQTLTGLITLSSRTNSTYGDGIPDSWRLRWFGTVNNYLSVSNACPTGDGINNWKKYGAGVDPNSANDFPSVNPRTPTPAGYSSAIHWPSVSGIHYVIERSGTLFGGKWTNISTNTGTGTDMEYDDISTGAVNFYRVLILP